MYQVLLVDDDKAVIYMLKRFTKWQQYGFEVAGAASDGKEALEKLERQHFDVVITDIRMPGMDGLEFLAELKLRKIEIPLLLLSTYNDFEYAQQGIRLGIFDYMTKPVDDYELGEVLDRLSEHLNSRYKERENALFYPEAKEQMLLTELLSGSLSAVSLAGDIAKELQAVFNQDTAKTAKVLERISFKLRENIFAVFPWLKNTEEWETPTLIVKAGGGLALERWFSGEVERLYTVIRKYELHQTDSVVKRTCESVLRHVEEDITLEVIAREVNVSKDYISKLFKQKTGGHFNEYLTKVKMEHAKYLLLRGELKNYEISERLGYSSPDYFGRLFKNYTGCTPLEFRRRGGK